MNHDHNGHERPGDALRTVARSKQPSRNSRPTRSPT